MLAHCNIKQNMCLCSKLSRLFSFYALPSGGKLKDMVVHWPNKVWQTNSSPIKPKGSWPIIFQSKTKIPWSRRLVPFANSTGGTRGWTVTITNYWDSGCGSVDRAVAFNSRDPRFESSHRQNFILNINCQLYWKDENKEKRGRDWPIF